MQEQYYGIGETAGKIYKCLEQKGEQTLAKVQKDIGADADIFNQAVGWLARENNINFNKMGKNVKISLLK
ncbi:MAG TPA: winged helix-turn-helix domain-containing protein [Candidatus Omnitrophota bacterium]|nr:winged helix-turn-helix domain-containing protein [Candidatus Omnitrophota bacterium]HPS37579.1 winged helix-turn-helix domain-containing protein [Candidatus Omnitrophota bacterium]